MEKNKKVAPIKTTKISRLSLSTSFHCFVKNFFWYSFFSLPQSRAFISTPMLNTVVCALFFMPTYIYIWSFLFRRIKSVSALMHHQYSLLFLRCLFVILYAHKMHFRFVVTKNIAMNTQREKVYLRCTVHIFSQQLSQTAAAQQKVFYTLFFSPFTTIFLATNNSSRKQRSASGNVCSLFSVRCTATAASEARKII